MKVLEDTDLDPAQGRDYRYERFTPRLLLKDLIFRSGALGPGDSMPALDLANVEGGTLRVGGPSERPLLLVTGSITCPMTASAMPVLDRLHREFGDSVDFVLLATREAHPGDHYPQPHTPEDKLAHAGALRDHYSVPFPVAVDDIDGSLHQLLDGKPNTAYLIGSDGTIAFRSHWARDEGALRTALTNVANGEAPSKAKSRAMVGPVARAMGSVDQVMRRAGPKAQRDLWLTAFPMAASGLISRAFRFSDPDRRGIAAMATFGIVSVATEVAFLAVVL